MNEPSGRNRHGLGEQFGPLGGEAAEQARYLLDELTSLAPGVEVLSHEGQIMEYLMEFELNVALMEVPFDTHAEARLHLHDELVRFHSLLPFTEPEREWLVDRYQANSDIPSTSRETAAELTRHKGEIMSAGTRQKVDGRELMERWRRWLTASGEFEHDPARHEASDALKALRDTLH